MDKIKLVKTSDLIPYANNARTHSENQIAQVAASIREFGFTNPVLIDDDNGIIAGHGRVQAARLLKMDEVPCIALSGLTKAQIRAYIIADNKLAMNAGWDDELLSLEITGLKDEDFDIDLLGFSTEELDDLLSLNEGTEGLTDEDAVPDIPDEPISVLGDIWILGNHRLMCGDSTSIDAVEKLMDGQKADMVFTDPPYNIDFKPPRGTHDRILNDSMSDASFSDFLDGMLACALSSMNPNTYAFIWTGWSKLGAFEKAISRVFKIQAFHVWVKNNFGIGYYSRPKHEPFYLCLNGEPIRPQTAPADVWEAKKVHKTVHSCEKPVDLIVTIMETYNKNGVTLDLFGGSGSTLIACEKTNRNCRMMELDPRYTDVIINRWQDFTGQSAILERSGQPFSEISDAA